MDPFDLKQLGLDIEFPYRKQYDNYIGGKWVPPVGGNYFENVSPINGKPFCRIPRSSGEDIELAIDAAHAARRKWGKTSTTERGNLLLAVADRMEKNLKLLAVAETIDNGKPLRETM
jgi:aldehyde dehydrogenase